MARKTDDGVLLRVPGFVGLPLWLLNFVGARHSSVVAVNMARKICTPVANVVVAVAAM